MNSRIFKVPLGVEVSYVEIYTCRLGIKLQLK